MADLVVTVPKGLWLDWIEEGDAVGENASGEEWGFFLGGSRPAVEPGERLYIVAHERIRGYAPVTRVAQTERGWAICRNHGAVAVTTGEIIPGFRGWRKRWWPRELEVEFPAWKYERVKPLNRDDVNTLGRHSREFERLSHQSPTGGGGRDGC